MYSTSEASKIMGISPVHLRYLLAKGEIEGKKLGHDWVVLSLDYKRKRKPKTPRNKGGENEKSWPKVDQKKITQMWARLDSNQRPIGYEPTALPLSYGPARDTCVCSELKKYSSN